MCVGGLLAFWPGVGPPVREALRARTDRPRRTLALGLLALFLALSVLPPLRSLPASQRQDARLPGTKADVVSTAASILQGESRGDEGVAERLALWRGALRMVSDHPLLGVGPGGWVRMHPLYDRGATVTVSGYPRRPHNDYLWIASEYGLIGLGVHLWFLGAGFVCLLKMARGPEHFPRIVALMFALSLLSLLGAAFFGFPKEQAHTAMFPYLLFGVAASGTTPRRIDLRARVSGPLLLIFPLIISLGTIELDRRRISFERHFLRAFSGGVYSKNWQAVLTEAQRATQQGTFQSDVLFFKGLALQHLGRYAEAEGVYRQLLTYAPHAWYGHDGLGFVCLHQGPERLGEALKHCQTAIALCPSAIYIRTNIGVIYQKMGNPDQAEKEFRAVLQATPGDVEAHLSLGSLYQSRGQLDSAAVHYEQALRTAPDMPLAHLNLAHTYLKQGRLQDAFPHFEKALTEYPDDPNIHWGLGLALEAGGRLKEAETSYRKVVALQPHYAQGHLVLGNVLYAQGSYQGALNAYRTFLAISQSDTTNVRFAKERVELCEEKT